MWISIGCFYEYKKYVYISCSILKWLGFLKQTKIELYQKKYLNNILTNFGWSNYPIKIISVLVLYEIQFFPKC